MQHGTQGMSDDSTNGCLWSGRTRPDPLRSRFRRQGPAMKLAVASAVDPSLSSVPLAPPNCLFSPVPAHQAAATTNRWPVRLVISPVLRVRVARYQRLVGDELVALI